MADGKLALLKSLRLLQGASDAQLEALGEYLKPRDLPDGGVVFEQGSAGDSLFFVSAGMVRISKKMAEGARDLALLEPGDCFGEMALVDAGGRSARASAAGRTTVMELTRADLERWLKKNPELAIQFFTQLVQIQSKRLRRTSSELALLNDLANLFLDPGAGPKELLGKALDRVLPHLEGSWAAAAVLYNVFNDEMEEVARRGQADFEALSAKLPPLKEARCEWLDERTFYAALPSVKGGLGYLLLRAEAAIEPEGRGEMARVLQSTAHLLGSAIENVNYRNEDALRARLKGASSGTL